MTHVHTEVLNNYNKHRQHKLIKCADSKLNNRVHTRRGIQRESDTLCVIHSLNPTETPLNNIPLFLLQKKGKVSPLRPCIPSGSELITPIPFYGMEHWVPQKDPLALWTEQAKTTESTVSLLSKGGNISLSSQPRQPTPSAILTAPFHPAPYSSHPRRQPWTSSIDGRPTPAAPARQSASAGPYTHQP